MTPYVFSKRTVCFEFVEKRKYAAATSGNQEKREGTGSKNEVVS
jgi:hypothetical protein